MPSIMNGMTISPVRVETPCDEGVTLKTGLGVGCDVHAAGHVLSAAAPLLYFHCELRSSREQRSDAVAKLCGV